MPVTFPVAPAAEVAVPPLPAGPADAELLARFVAGPEPAALEALVRRHGPMVLGVCRRALGDTPDADDAFQATFLVFVRKAGTLDRPELLANWLYGVAFRVARKAKLLALSRHAREVPMPQTPLPDPRDEAARRDLRLALDEELARLPDKYRVPLVMCGLQGWSLDEAAAKLGWPKGTVAGRLSRARDQLRHRLGARAVLPAGFALPAPAALPEPLVASAVDMGTPGKAARYPAAIALADSVQSEGRRRARHVVTSLLAAGLVTLAGVKAWALVPPSARSAASGEPHCCKSAMMTPNDGQAAPEAPPNCPPDPAH
jgi:RNA polymerase sigma factor (sigma-70 family)